MLNKGFIDLDFVYGYNDDLIVFFPFFIFFFFEDYIKYLEIIFYSLKYIDIRIVPDKCIFAKHEVEFLGHSVSERWVKPIESNVEFIIEFHLPSSLRTLWLYLGMLIYYKSFLPQATDTLKFLHVLLNDCGYGKTKPITWTDTSIVAFNKSKRGV